MKIGISCYPTHGGSGVVATELGIELARRGHEVHFISYSIPFRLKRYQENVYFHEVQVTSYPLFQYPPYTLALAAKMAEVADEAGLDILHAHEQQCRQQLAIAQPVANPIGDFFQ